MADVTNDRAMISEREMVSEKVAPTLVGRVLNSFDLVVIFGAGRGPDHLMAAWRSSAVPVALARMRPAARPSRLPYSRPA